MRCQLCGEIHVTSLKSLINGALIIEKNADEKGAPFDRQDPEKNRASDALYTFIV